LSSPKRRGRGFNDSTRGLHSERPKEEEGRDPEWGRERRRRDHSPPPSRRRDDYDRRRDFQRRGPPPRSPPSHFRNTTNNNSYRGDRRRPPPPPSSSSTPPLGGGGPTNRLRQRSAARTVFQDSWYFPISLRPLLGYKSFILGLKGGEDFGFYSLLICY